MKCNHDKVCYLGQMIDESAKELLAPKIYEQFEHYDLYNCVRCNTTVAIDRRDIGELEKRVVQVGGVNNG